MITIQYEDAEGHITPLQTYDADRVTEVWLNDDGMVVRLATAKHTWAFSPVLGIRSVTLYTALNQVLALDGDLAEFGVYRGDTLRGLAAFLQQCQSPKQVHGFDTFTGLPLAPGIDYDGPRYQASMEEVHTTMVGLTNYHLYPGLFADYAASFQTPLCFAHIDADLYEGTASAIQICQRCLVPGGIVVIDDYDTAWTGVKQACDALLLPQDWHCVAQPGQLIATRMGRRTIMAA